MFGPAIDQPDFSETFFRSLLRWVDVETCGRFLSENVPIRGSINSSWAGLGLPLRLPSSPNAETFRLIILHARNKSTRASLPFGGSRIRGSSLLNSDPGRPSGVTLTHEAALTVSQSNSIVYTVDLRPTTDSPSSNSLEADERWAQMRMELIAVIAIMSDNQKLLILGLQRTASDLGNRIRPYEVVKHLNIASSSSETGKLLNEKRINWRVWCTSADEVNSAHLEQIFSWLTYDEESILK
ncbi:unnamed protein product [Echinostoma caproni]|uniref:Uncharacterized protein n=1 Tax=Echinostoma caproni TaxID=27848 RepID=A0A183AER7_9TREM|nr:unnamed protein product [Echinostoma caproni]